MCSCTGAFRAGTPGSSKSGRFHCDRSTSSYEQLLLELPAECCKTISCTQDAIGLPLHAGLVLPIMIPIAFARLCSGVELACMF